MDTLCSGRDLKGNKQPLVPMMCDQICGNSRLMQRTRKKNKDGLSRNQISTVPENRGIFFIEQNDEEFKLTMKVAR